jgi:hypothetical protein
MTFVVKHTILSSMIVTAAGCHTFPSYSQSGWQAIGERMVSSMKRSMDAKTISRGQLGSTAWLLGPVPIPFTIQLAPY